MQKLLHAEEIGWFEHKFKKKEQDGYKYKAIDNLMRLKSLPTLLKTGAKYEEIWALFHAMYRSKTYVFYAYLNLVYWIWR